MRVETENGTAAMLHLEPRGSWIVVEKREAKRASSVLLTGSAKPMEYVVEKLGPGTQTADGPVAIQGLQPGDRVILDLALTPVGGGRTVSQWPHLKCAVTGRVLLLVPEDAVQAVYQGDFDAGR